MGSSKMFKIALKCKKRKKEIGKRLGERYKKLLKKGKIKFAGGKMTEGFIGYDHHMSVDYYSDEDIRKFLKQLGKKDPEITIKIYYFNTEYKELDIYKIKNGKIKMKSVDITKKGVNGVEIENEITKYFLTGEEKKYDPKEIDKMLKNMKQMSKKESSKLMTDLLDRMIGMPKH